jgi:Xaa-Pro aminopeptidase
MCPVRLPKVVLCDAESAGCGTGSWLPGPTASSRTTAGHGVGLSVFDDPHVIPTDQQRLESWMVMALELGVYLPGRFGVRRENLFLVTPDGGRADPGGEPPLDARAQADWNV